MRDVGAPLVVEGLRRWPRRKYQREINSAGFNPKAPLYFIVIRDLQENFRHHRTLSPVPLKKKKTQTEPSSLLSYKTKSGRKRWSNILDVYTHLHRNVRNEAGRKVWEGEKCKKTLRGEKYARCITCSVAGKHITGENGLTHFEARCYGTRSQVL